MLHICLVGFLYIVFYAFKTLVWEGVLRFLPVYQRGPWKGQELLT